MLLTESLDHNIYQVPLVDLKTIYRSTGYVIKEEKTILIETGAAPSNDIIHNSLKELDIQPEQVDYIAVTHIHLDHAGGAGLLMEQCPNAKLLVHQRGAKHMADPEKLIAGARQVYGNAFDSLFKPILPIPAERIKVMEDGDTLDLGNNRILHFLDAPGHAFHHLVVNDPTSKGLFSGDNAGIFFRQLYDDQGIAFSLPVTAPTQFVPEIMVKTMDRLISLNPERVYFTHYGMAENGVALLQQAKKLVSFFGDDCAKHYQKERSFEKLFEFIRERLYSELAALGVTGDIPEKGSLDNDIKLNIQGVIAYVEKLERG
ncbi:MAG: MBL fold metallo-hydrolase [Proteobacteria bacterium]|nr:MBL fold metallo-hydrolase [Pseudomonadota bacterium]